MDRRVVRTLPIWVAVALLPLPTVAGAQTPPSLTVGTRVRVWTGAGSDIGTFGGADDGYIRLVTDSSHTRQIPSSEVLRIDQYAGRHRQTWTGLLIGFLGGATVGAAAYAIANPEEDPGDPYSGYFAASMLGSLAGALAGGAIGHFSFKDSWHTVVPAPVAAVTREPDGTVAARLGVRLPLGRDRVTSRR